MSRRPSVYPRIQRRETHSSRAGVAIVLAVALIAASAYLATETVLAALGRAPLLVSPTQMAQDALQLDTAPAAILGAGGAVLAVVGAGLIVAALAPGRRARHVQPTERAAVVIDNEVIASALVKAAATEAGVTPDRAVGSVSHRRAVVRITPSSGRAIDRDAVLAAMRDRLESWALTPRISPRIVIEKTGKVGA